MKWLFSCRALLSTLLFSGALAAQPSLPGLPDVRANVMKMLEEARLRGETSGLTPGEEAEVQRAVAGGEGDPVPSAEPDLFDRLEGHSGAGPEVNSESRPEAKPVATPDRVAPPVMKDGSPHVMLPQKEITIRDLNDLKQLSREFQDAREQKQ